MQEPNSHETNELKLTLKQERALAALFEEPTLKKAAAAAGINPSTLWRWLQTPDFHKAFMHARWKAVQQSIARLQHFTSDAASALAEIVNDKSMPGYTRVAAANSIMASAIKGVELEDHDERIADIQRDLDLAKTQE
jgi:hypothetical protein